MIQLINKRSRLRVCLIVNKINLSIYYIYELMFSFIIIIIYQIVLNYFKNCASRLKKHHFYGSCIFQGAHVLLLPTNI